MHIPQLEGRRVRRREVWMAATLAALVLLVALGCGRLWSSAGVLFLGVYSVYVVESVLTAVRLIP